MADPLSVTASIIAVVGAANTVTKGLGHLKAAKDAPEGLKDLISDVAQLEMVLNRVKSVVLSSNSPPIELATLIGEAGSKLLEVQSLIEYTLTKAGVSNQVDRWQWLRKGNEVERLRNQLGTIRLNLVTLTSSVNFGVLQRVSLVTQDLSSEQQRLNAQMTNVLPRQEALLNQLCQKIDESQATQAAMMRLSGNFRQVDVDVASDYAASLSESLESRAVAPVITRPRMRSRHEFHIQNIQIHSACPVACTCNCHSRWKVSTPWKLRRLFGHGTIEGVGLPFFKGACSLRSCKGEGATFININFFLPAMVASRLISFWFTSSPLHAPELLLRVPRVLRTDTAAYKAISDGDLDAVKRCISAGECKPWDVDHWGQSLIATAMEYHHSTIALYLAQAASDDYECLREIYTGAWWYYTIGGTVCSWENPLPGRAILSTLVIRQRRGKRQRDSPLDLDRVPGVDWNELLEMNGFSELHKIVCGVSRRPIDVEIKARPEDIDRRDSAGLTALWYACWLGNGNHIRTLIKYGADVNSSSVPPISAGVWTGSYDSVEQLLEAGAYIPDQSMSTFYETLMNLPSHLGEEYEKETLAIDKALFGRFLSVDHIPLFGDCPLINLVKRRTPPSHTRMRQLLQLGADIELPDEEGLTALCHAISANNTEACKILGRAGANANIRTKAGHTILHLAIKNAWDANTIQAVSELDLLGVELGAKDIWGYTAFELFEFRAGRCRNDSPIFPGRHSSYKSDFALYLMRELALLDRGIVYIDRELQLLLAFQTLLQQVQEAQGIPIEDRYPLLTLTRESLISFLLKVNNPEPDVPSVPGAWPET